MNATPRSAQDDVIDKIETALQDEDFELLSEATGDLLRTYESPGNEHMDAQYYYAKYLSLFAKGYRKWQISYNYTEVRNYFYAAQRWLDRAEPTPDLAKAFNSLTRMVNAYTRCENSYVNDDPSGLVTHARQAQNAEQEGLKNLRPVLPRDRFALILRAWLHRYFVKNLRLHRGLEACGQIYSAILQRKAVGEREIDGGFGIASKALKKLSNARSKAQSVELASELNAHLRFIRQHQERTQTTSPNVSPTFLRLKEGIVTLCLSAGCDQKAARNAMIGDGEEFKQYLIRERGLEVRNFRPAPLHDIFQTSFGSHSLQMLTFDLPSIRISINDSPKREFKFDVKVKLTSLGTCAVYLSHEIEEPGLTVEEFRTIQSLICPHSGQIQIKDDSETKSEFASEFIKKSKCDSLNGLRPLLRTNGDSTEIFLHARQDALEEPGNSTEEFAGWLDFQCQPHALVYLQGFSAWILDSVGKAFRKCVGNVEASEEDYEHDRTWLVLHDVGWYSHVQVRSLSIEDSQGNSDVLTDSFEKIKEHPDVQGFLIEPREARASFDDWRFMTFRWMGYQNLALIRSHPCDAFFVSENRAFLYFPDDPKFLADQYEVTVELMIWLGTALKFCEALSQRLVQHVLDGLNTDGSDLDHKTVARHLDWISRLRVQAGAIQALVSKTGISRYADHGELMTQMVENMMFPRIAKLLDNRLIQFDEYYKKIDETREHDSERRSRLSELLLVLLGTLLAVSNVPAIRDAYKSDPAFMCRTFIVAGAVFLIGVAIFYGKQIFRSIKDLVS